ncbi:uncharacterized protein N7459_002359 [Penicillium hispanicum]|uniref:uncharacterized protein n=1 Tax=Penicillium hispanicum TaxID=1080232 RepID=UPI002540CA9F|nr:uncharacterized protein N7459_002359 [Penicillium hispanicum]KAJ5591990.1 hypothetical protein N7459_002359 [Penicillium hispanicum]
MRENASDLFQLLPLELLHEVAKRISTKDYLSLRLASRAAVSLWDSQSFWKTRFYMNGDRGFLSYLTEGDQSLPSGQPRDWRSLYRITRRAANWKRLRVRYTLWTKAKWFQDMYVMTKPPKVSLSWGEWCQVRKLQWQTVVAAIKHGIHSMNTRPGQCVKEKALSQTVLIDKAVVKLGVSILQEKDKTYIAGIDLVRNGLQADRTLGYRIPGKQLFVDVEPSFHIKGFEVYLDDSAIHAIRLSTPHVEVIHSTRQSLASSEEGPN